METPSTIPVWYCGSLSMELQCEAEGHSKVSRAKSSGRERM